MLSELPTYLSLVFGMTTGLSLFLFHKTLKKSSLSAKENNQILAFLILWSAIQGIIAFTGFYAAETDTFPPPFLLVLGPALVSILYLFNSQKGKAFIDSLDMEAMSWLHIVRIPVEIVLYWLALSKVIPELMTFAGRNFDIIAGLTAPIVAYWGIKKGNMGRNALLIWNFICLGLLLFIVANALLSAPFPFQQFAFDQPNIAVLHFPFVWLPALIVPLVLFFHLASIRQLLYPSLKSVGSSELAKEA